MKIRVIQNNEYKRRKSSIKTRNFRDPQVKRSRQSENVSWVNHPNYSMGIFAAVATDEMKKDSRHRK